MKKIFLTTITLLSIASASVFGMYGANSGWINFLTHGNQFRARMNQLGFTLGNDTIKGTFGFFNDGRGAYGSMLSQSTATGEAGTGLWFSVFDSMLFSFGSRPQGGRIIPRPDRQSASECRQTGGCGNNPHSPDRSRRRSRPEW